MRLVKTADEISKIQAVYARCQYLGTRNLTVSFETTPAIVRALQYRTEPMRDQGWPSASIKMIWARRRVAAFGCRR